MTSSGGTGRPASNQGARDASVPPPEPGQRGAPTGGDNKTSGPIATEVVAALRAQGQAQPNSSGERGDDNPPSARNSNGSGNGRPQNSPERQAPDPAVNPRRQPAQADEAGQQRGAAAARAATKATRTRQDTTPRTADDATPNPWARPSEQQDTSRDKDGRPSPEPQPAAPPQPGSGQQAGQQGPPPPTAAQRQAPVPPPSLVAKQRQQTAAAAQASSPAAPPAPAPAPNPAAAPGLTPQPPTADTQASMDAVPAVETPQSKPSRMPTTRRSGRIRKARLRLLRVDPWSVMKTAFLLSVALGITLFVAVAVLWSVLDAAGVFSSVDEIVTDMTASDSSSGIDINQYVELSRVLGFTTLIAVVDVVLLTALATLGAFLYNLSASLLGGLELTLAEDD